MKYPTLSYSKCRDLALARIRGDDPPVEAQWVGQGQEVDVRRIEMAAGKIKKLIASDNHGRRRPDQTEGEAAKILGRTLCLTGERDPGAPDVSVLDDPGFWRYLSMMWFWEFVQWREWEEPSRFKEQKHLRYVDGRISTECVLTRMLLRSMSLGGPDHQELAACLPNATDFWRSHILRVRTASAPRVTRAMVELQRDDPLRTSDVREFAKRKNRTWTNVILHLYDYAEAFNLLTELRVGLPETHKKDKGAAQE